MEGNKSFSKEGQLQWWQLSLIGVGCIIGTGYFLGSGLAIRNAGPSVIISYILAAFSTYAVYDALAKMTKNDPQKGSFRSYAKKAYGRWAGFSTGWVYWCSEMLIMGSQMTALSIFSRFWFPNVPLWVFAAGYAVLGIVVVLTGTKGFDRLENIFAVIKISAIFMFIIIASLAIFGVLDGKSHFRAPTTIEQLFPNGVIGLWASLIFAFYSFGGIEMMGIMAIRLRKKEDAPKAGSLMLFLLAVIYCISLGLVVMMDSWRAFQSKESPFVIALNDFQLPFFPHVFNGALIIAGFSTMCASLFSVTSMVVTLAQDGDAPASLAKKGKWKIHVPILALALTAAGMTASVVLALVMPNRVYEYITTAASLMLLYNWFFILLSSRRIIKLNARSKAKGWMAMIFIALAVSGTLWEKTSRIGFFGSLIFVVMIALVVLKMRTGWKKERKMEPV
jgi:L-asparagine transporter-like permease